MKVNNNTQYSPSFKAKVVHNKALRATLRDIKNRYGAVYIRKAANQISKIGTNQDEIKLIYSTFDYKKGLALKPRAEGVTFALINGKNMGHFENRFVSNFLQTAKRRIVFGYPAYQRQNNKKFENQVETITKIKKTLKKENIFVKMYKKFVKFYNEEY